MSIKVGMRNAGCPYTVIEVGVMFGNEHVLCYSEQSCEPWAVGKYAQCTEKGIVWANGYYFVHEEDARAFFNALF